MKQEGSEIESGFGMVPSRSLLEPPECLPIVRVDTLPVEVHEGDLVLVLPHSYSPSTLSATQRARGWPIRTTSLASTSADSLTRPWPLAARCSRSITQRADVRASLDGDRVGQHRFPLCLVQLELLQVAALPHARKLLL